MAKKDQVNRRKRNVRGMMQVTLKSLIKVRMTTKTMWLIQVVNKVPKKIS